MPVFNVGDLDYVDKLNTLAASVASLASVTWVDAEVPAGAVDGVNDTFVLADSPSPAASLRLYVNGLLQRAGGVDFALAGSTITFVSGAVPQAGDSLLSYYRK